MLNTALVGHLRKSRKSPETTNSTNTANSNQIRGCGANGGMKARDAKRRKQLEQENARLKRRMADQALRTFFRPDMLGSDWSGFSWASGSFPDTFNPLGQTAFSLRLDGVSVIGLFDDSGWRQLVENGSLLDLNAAGQIVFSADSGLYMYDGSGIVTVAVPGDSAPDGNGVLGRYGVGHGQAVIGAGGRIVFIDTLEETMAFELDDTAESR